MKIIQIFKPEERFYNVYRETFTNCIARPVQYLGLTESGEIVGIELGKHGFDVNSSKRKGYAFTTSFSELIEFGKDPLINLTILEKDVKIEM